MKKILFLFFTFSIAIKAGAQLHADFIADTTNGCWPLVVQFTDLSTGNPTEWLWDLGNGVTSTKQTPSVAYTMPGNYTVKLRIKNVSGEDSITKTNYIIIHENPVTNFTAFPTQGCTPLNVKFTDLSTSGSGTLVNWLWDFGDGITATEQNPAHTYNIVDSFNVTLQATNNFGCKTVLNKPFYIKLGGVIQAGFTYTYDNNCTAPVLIDFTNTSKSNNPLTYQWDFGDGSAKSTEKNPKHTYLKSGNFTVTLIATNKTGCTDSFIETILIGTSQTNFGFTNTCVNAPVIFTDSSSPVPLKTIWDFGDGTKDSGATVTHTYNAKGNYTVTQNTDFGGCKGSAKKTVSITDKPKADFNVVGNGQPCAYPATIQFKNQSKGATTYKWIFDNGTESADENASFTYNKPGKYNVTLIAFNTGGCSDTLVKDNYIQIGSPEIDSVKNLPYQGCAPATLTLTPFVYPAALSNTYFWDFGDGTTSTSATPTHTYNIGTYNVTLIVTKAGGCSDTLFIPKAVALGKRPKAAFSANPTNTCASTPVQFTDASTGGITEWIWSFGDNLTSSEQNPLHDYKDTGYMDVTLVVGQYKCYDTTTIKKYIYITPPVAKFNIGLDCNSPLTYSFTDNSIGATSWRWDFGDGSTSNTTSPSHTYNKNGLYHISLTVSNGVCSETVYDSINVIQENPLIQYKFLSSKSCKYDSVRFSVTNYNPANYTVYQWDFGDGVVTDFSETDSIIYHVYNNAGTYNPTLILKTINSCTDTVNNIQLKVNGPAAAFSNVPGDCINSTITFKDSSTVYGNSSLIKWIWNYGDNTPTETLSGAPFKHKYDTAGIFNISLKVFDNNNCYDSTNYTGLEITNPVADFSVSDSINCSQDAIQFNNLSNGLFLNFNWDFGDGNISSDAFPSHTYTTDGTYNVKLKTIDKYNCTDSILKLKYITISTPVADFELNDSVFTCPPAKLIPVNKTSFGYKRVLWDFGDGNTSEEINPEHYYILAGTFEVKLIVYGYGSCTDTLSKKIFVQGPIATYTYAPLVDCDSVQTAFSAVGKNVVKYTWDFGNGVTQTTSGPAANFTYTNPGKYLPKLVIEDSTGCRVAIINSDSITVAKATARFNIARIPGICDSSLFQFTDSSNILFDTITAYNWSFGDGSSASISNPKHFYNIEGLYNTSLSIVTKNGCQSTQQLPLNVSINQSPKILSTIPDSTCANTMISLTADVSDNNTPDNYVWRWDFGDGNYADTQNVKHTYPNAGAYNISVSATTIAGCSGTDSQQLIVNPLPQTDAGADQIICREQSTNLQASGADTYLWIANPSLSCVACSTTIASPLLNSTYYVTGYNIFGCATPDSVTIQVKQPANVSITAPDTTCAGTTIQLTASGAELYRWEPGNLVSGSTDSIITSTPLSPVTYTLFGTDSKGCFTDTASVFVNVFPIPTIQLKDSVVEIGVGSSFQLNAVASPDVTNWMWSPAMNITCTNCPNPIVSPKQTIAYKVSVSNPAGCTAEKSVTVIVSCNKDQNIFVPNTFSPNSDGINDYFYPRGKGLVTIKSLRIFNRLGNIVFLKTNFPANQQSYGWDGTYNGKTLPPDVYVYMLEITCENGQTLNSKGNVTLLR